MNKGGMQKIDSNQAPLSHKANTGIQILDQNSLFGARVAMMTGGTRSPRNNSIPFGIANKKQMIVQNTYSFGRTHGVLPRM